MRPGDVIAERFEVERLAGEGGMGAVYRALDLLSGGAVAVKMLHRQGAEEVRRFAREAVLLAEIPHPGVVRYVAHGISSAGDLWLAMEWLYCATSRTEPDDCCGSPGCSRWTQQQYDCRGGNCFFLGCVADAECVGAASFVCRQLDSGYGVCAEPCTDEQDCEGGACAVDDDAQTRDLANGDETFCQEEDDCQVVGCADEPGTVCDELTGDCVCTPGSCNEGWECITWDCERVTIEELSLPNEIGAPCEDDRDCPPEGRCCVSPEECEDTVDVDYCRCIPR
ncbi:MAG: hypothetical protein HYY06_24055 [Deltaproteobacteria bacterium]|nr:hypothetical protein [Deltaproteobacteria bacterium]